MAKFTQKKDTIVKEPVHRHERSYKSSRRDIMFNNFIGGIFWAVGTVFGLALIFGVLGIVSRYVNLIPFIGDFIAEIIDYLKFNRGIR